LMKAKDALRGVIDDGMKASLIWLQALSEPANPFSVDENLGDMRGLRVTRDKLLTFKRVNPLLDCDWLEQRLGVKLSEQVLAKTREFDNARKANLNRLHQIGKAAGERLVEEADFPRAFDVSPAAARTATAA